MNPSPAETCRSYGDVTALNDSKVIVGDYQSCIRIESSTVNISCPHVVEIIAGAHRTSSYGFKAVLKSSSQPTRTPGSSAKQQRFADQHMQCHDDSISTRSAQHNSSCVGKSLKLGTIRLPISPAVPPTDPQIGMHHIETPADDPNFMSPPATDPNEYQFRIAYNHQDTTFRKPKFVGTNRRLETTAESVTQSLATTTHGIPLSDVDVISVIIQDNLEKPCAFAPKDSQYRLFLFSRIGPDWTQSTCAESFMPASQISHRVNRGPTNSRFKTQNIKLKLENLEVRRRRALEYLLHEVNRCDPNGYSWYIVAVDNENARHAKRTGDVTVFSTILAR